MSKHAFVEREDSELDLVESAARATSPAIRAEQLGARRRRSRARETEINESRQTRHPLKDRGRGGDFPARRAGKFCCVGLGEARSSSGRREQVIWTTALQPSRWDEKKTI